MSSAYDKAIKLLKIRPHHSEELTKKLLMRGFKREEISEVITNLTQQKLLDNDQFAQMYLDELIKYKTYGFFGLKSKLMQRGIASNAASKLLQENLSIEKELMIAKKIADREHDIGKLAQKLQRKGFRMDVIRRVTFPSNGEFFPQSADEY